MANRIYNIGKFYK